jgi:hypothetical protein
MRDGPVRAFLLEFDADTVRRKVGFQNTVIDLSKEIFIARLVLDEAAPLQILGNPLHSESLREVVRDDGWPFKERMFPRLANGGRI